MIGCFNFKHNTDFNCLLKTFLLVIIISDLELKEMVKLIRRFLLNYLPDILCKEAN